MFGVVGVLISYGCIRLKKYMKVRQESEDSRENLEDSSKRRIDVHPPTFFLQFCRLMTLLMYFSVTELVVSPALS